MNNDKEIMVLFTINGNPGLISLNYIWCIYEIFSFNQMMLDLLEALLTDDSITGSIDVDEIDGDYT